MKTFLISGGAGYIGSHMAHYLVDAGHKVVIVDNLTNGHQELIPFEATFYKCDISDIQSLQSIIESHRPEAVFHFAAHIRVDESVEKPMMYYINNTFNAAAFFNLCSTAGIKNLIFSSTAAVYGTPTVSCVSEECEIKPESPYGKSKYMSEQILKDIAACSSMKFVILRYFNVAGARPDLKSGQISNSATHLIKVASEVATKKRPQLLVYGVDYPTHDGTCIRDYIHVQDLVDAHWLAYQFLNHGGSSDTFNLGYGKGYSVLEVLNTFKNANGVDLSYKIGPRRLGDAVKIVANPSRAIKLLNWSPRYDSLDLICRTAFDWEKKLISMNT